MKQGESSHQKRDALAQGAGIKKPHRVCPVDGCVYTSIKTEIPLFFKG